MAALPLLALLAAAAMADGNIDLPVATQGTEQWAGVLAKAMSAGGKNQDESLQALQSFQDKIFAKISKTVWHTVVPCTFPASMIVCHVFAAPGALLFCESMTLAECGSIISNTDLIYTTLGFCSCLRLVALQESHVMPKQHWVGSRSQH